MLGFPVRQSTPLLEVFFEKHPVCILYEMFGKNASLVWEFYETLIRDPKTKPIYRKYRAVLVS